MSGRPLFEDRNALYALFTILLDMLDDSSLARVYLMVDAVDECDSDQLKLLDFIADSRSKLRRQHRCLCTEKQVWMQYLAKNA